MLTLVGRALLRWALPAGAAVHEEIAHAGVGGRAFLVVAGSDRWVAKVAFDGPANVIPGLAIAERLAGAGLATGPPLRTRDGLLAVDIAASGRLATVAVLRWEVGTYIDLAAPLNAARLGSLLGQVHAVLRASTASTDVPARLLDWWHDHAVVTGDHLATELLQTLTTAGASELPHAVVYGDPHPEVLDDGQRLALIDWGTPSWGPLVHDVAAWLRHLRLGGAPPDTCDRFLGAYQARRPITDEELTLLDTWEQLVATIRPGP